MSFKNLIFKLTLSFLCSFSLSVFSADLELLEIDEDHLSHLSKLSRHYFETDQYQFNCAETEVFSEKAQVILSEKEIYSYKEILPQGKSHQCFILSKLDHTQIGQGFISVRKIQDQKVVSGLLTVGGKTFFRPPLEPVYENKAIFVQPQNIKNEKLDCESDQYSFQAQDSKYRPDPMKDFPPLPPVARDDSPRENPLRRILIDIETDNEFLELFRLEGERNLNLARERALAYIENYYGQVSMVKSKDMKIAVNVDRVYLYMGSDPWIGGTRTRILYDVETFWNGIGWVYEDAMGEDMERVEGIDRAETSDPDLFRVYVRDHRPRAGIRGNRLRQQGLSLVQILSGSFRGGRGHSDGDIEKSLPLFGNKNAFSIVGVQPAEGVFIESDEVYINYIQGLSHRSNGHFYSFLTIVHEMGHNFGLSHTHNRGIDQCDCEEINEGDCEDFEEVQEVGYIMSYCSERNLEHDDQGATSFRSELNLKDNEFKRTYTPTIENQAPRILSIDAPLHASSNDAAQITVVAEDEDNDFLYYEFRIGDDVIYSLLPSIDYVFFNAEPQNFEINVTVYDSKYASTTISRTVYDRRLPPENIRLVFKNNQGVEISSDRVPLRTPIILSLQSYNAGGGDIRCELELSDGTVFQGVPLNNPLVEWNTECIFPHQFNSLGSDQIISRVFENNRAPLNNQHHYEVVHGGENLLPVITNFMRVNGNNLIPLEQAQVLPSISAGGSVGFEINLFEPEGEEAICELSLSNGRQIRLISEVTNNNPQERHCRFESLTIEDAGDYRITFSVRDPIEIIPLGFDNVNGINIPRFERRESVDPVDGVRWVDLEVMPNEIPNPEVYRLSVVNQFTQENINFEFDSIYQYNPVQFILEYQGAGFEDISCEIMIDGVFYEQPIRYERRNQSKLCKMTYEFVEVGASELSIRLIDRNGRVVNPILSPLDHLGYAHQSGGRILKRFDILPPEAPFVLSLNTITNGRTDVEWEPQPMSENIQFRLMLLNPNGYDQDRERIECRISFGDGEEITVDAVRLNHRYSECLFFHDYSESGNFRIDYQSSLIRNEQSFSNQHGRGSKLMVIIPDGLPALGEVFQAIWGEDGRSELIPVFDRDVYSDEITNLYVPVFRNSNHPVQCELRVNDETDIVNATFNGDGERGFCTFSKTFQVYLGREFSSYVLRLKAFINDPDPVWDPEVGEKSEIITVRNR